MIISVEHFTHKPHADVILLEKSGSWKAQLLTKGAGAAGSGW